MPQVTGSGALAHPELSNALAAIHGQPEQVMDGRKFGRTMSYVTFQIRPICLPR